MLEEIVFDTRGTPGHLVAISVSQKFPNSGVLLRWIDDYYERGTSNYRAGLKSDS